MTQEEIQAIHDKLDALIAEVRLLRQDAHRKGSVLEDHEHRIEALERPSGEAAE